MTLIAKLQLIVAAIDEILAKSSLVQVELTALSSFLDTV